MTSRFMVQVEEANALRAEVARLTSERDAFKKVADACLPVAEKLKVQAEEALDQRDEARAALVMAREALTGVHCHPDNECVADCWALEAELKAKALAAIERCLPK